MKLLLSAAALTLTLGLAACGGSPTPPSEPTITPPPQQAPTEPDPPPVSGNYNIKLKALEGSDPRMIRVARLAAEFWENTITGEIVDGRVRLQPGACGNDEQVDEVVDDLLIFVGTENIDGPGKVLGQAGPCTYRNTTYFPSSGVLVLDSGDIQEMSDTDLMNLIIHEIAHTIGFGTMWETADLIGGTPQDPRFKGNHANSEYAALGGTGGAPLETTGGEGTALSHWRETTFSNELMTGWMQKGSNPMGRMTVASFRDLGYEVNFSQTAPTAGLGRLSLHSETLEEMENRLLRPTLSAQP